MKLTRFSMNEITLIGTVSKIKPATTNHRNLVRIEFDLATNDRFRDRNNQWCELPQFHHCDVIGNKAEQFNVFVKVGSYFWARGSVKTVTNPGSQLTGSRIQIREWSILSQADIDQIDGAVATTVIKGHS